MKKLTEYDSRKILEKYGLSVPKAELVKNRQDAVNAAKNVGFPCIMKIMSKDILHKSDCGGVVTNIQNEEQARDAFLEILERAKKYAPESKIDGVLVEETIRGKECIAGASKDMQFGPVLMFGLGGVFVEVMKDVSFRLIPAEKKEVYEMIKEIKAYPVLTGVRGEKPANIDAIANVLLCVSNMVKKEKIDEIDINPLIVNESGAYCADCRIIIN